MDYKVIISKQAEQDLNNIYSYIYNILKSKTSASKIAHRLQNTMSGLSVMPKRFQVYPLEPWFSREVRSVPVGNYMVFYFVKEAEGEVWITRIAYGKRDIENVLK